jgi:hypothetical protein
MTNANRTDVVRKGDSPWRVAERNLKNARLSGNSGQPVTNADIVKEMNRLAKLNGCDNVEDFNSKFFSSVGKEIITDKKEAKEKTAPKKAEAPGTPAKPKSRVVNKKIPKTQVPPKTAQEAHAIRINNMSSDEQRIIEHNKTNYQGQYYGIVDKKSCQLKIYDKQGNVVKTFTVGVGKSKGDGLGAYFLDHYQKTKDAYKAENNRYTTAGEFTLDEIPKSVDAYTGKDGKPKVMYLKGDNSGYRGGQMALHMLYKPQYTKREAAIKSKGLEDNRMSYGCVNLTEENWNEMHQYLGEGDKLYILPEEKGNKLQLEKQKNGSYKFAQAYHKSDRRDLTKEQASKVDYDVRPDRNPTYIAKQEAAKKQAASKQIAQVKTAMQKQETHWYDPRTWFS